MIHHYYNYKLWDITSIVHIRTVHMVAVITTEIVLNGTRITISTILIVTITMELILTCCCGRLSAVSLELSLLLLLGMFITGFIRREERKWWGKTSFRSVMRLWILNLTLRGLDVLRVLWLWISKRRVRRRPLKALSFFSFLERKALIYFEWFIAL